MAARVSHASDTDPLALPGIDVRVLIDRTSGSTQVAQRELRIVEQDIAVPGVPWAEDVLYVASGAVSLYVEPEQQTFELRQGHATFVPPTWPYRISAHGSEALVVSVASPPPEPGGAYTLPIRMDGRSAVAIHEDDQPPEPAGDDREFRLLIDPRHGARNLTQFVGFIDRSRAPFHTHTYEEAIYILEGEGLVHVQGEDGFDAPIRSGTSIFLPPGTPHCLENASAGVLKLLGVFSPPGSPAMKREG